MNGRCLPLMVTVILGVCLFGCEKEGGQAQMTSPLDTDGTSALMVASVEPADGATDVQTNTNVRATFSRDMDPASINAVIVLSTEGGQSIEGAVSYEGTTKTAVFLPLFHLEPSTSYTARVSQNAADTQGKKLGADYTWRFTTAGDTTAVLGPASPSPQGAQKWMWVEHNIGLGGTTIAGLVVDPQTPSTIYALTSQDGVYKTTDSGTNWKAVNEGLPESKSVQWWHMQGDLLTIDPNNPNILYTNMGGKVYKTTDGGKMWVEKNGAIHCYIAEEERESYQIAGVVVDPTTSGHLFAGHIAGGCPGGIYESTDGGDSWTRLEGYPGNDAWPLVIDPTNNKKIYTAANDGEFAYSSDGGGTWERKKVPNTSRGSAAVAINPLKPNRVFAGGYDKLYFCDFATDPETDEWGCGEWTPVDDVTGTTRSILFAPSDSHVGYVVSDNGLFKAVCDDELNCRWSRPHHGRVFPRVVAIDPRDPRNIYVGTVNAGVYKSTDSGSTARLSNKGLSQRTEVREVWASRLASFAAVEGHGLFLSRDGGQNWQVAYRAKYVVDLEFAPSDPNIVYAATIVPNKIIKSDDGGMTWAEILDPQVTIGGQPLDVSIQDLAIFPDDSGRVIGVARVQQSDMSVLFVTRDGGMIWDVYDDRDGRHKNPFVWSADSYRYIMVVAFSTDPAGKRSVYAFGLGDSFKSTDDGVTWKQINQGLECTVGSNPCDWVDAATIRPDDGTPYISTRAGKLFKLGSVGDEERWAEITPLPGNKEPTFMKFDLADPKTLYVSGHTAGTSYRSADGGNSWQALPSEGLPPGSSFPSMAQDPNNPSRLIFGSRYHGIYIYEPVGE